MKNKTLGLAFRAAVCIFVAGGIIEAARIVADTRETMELDYGEGMTVTQAARIFDLKATFDPGVQYPHMQYVPGYHFAVNLFTPVFGDALLAGRIISMTAAFWTVGLLGWIVFTVTKGYGSLSSRWSAVALTCAFAIQLPTMKWAPLVRVDLLGIALQFSALALIIAGRFRLSTQLIACGLLLLGLYTKQSLLTMPVVVLALVFLIRPGRGLRLSAAFGLAGALIFVAFAWATDGGSIRHWILYNVNGFSLRSAIFAEMAVTTNLAAVIGAGIAAFWLVAPPLKGIHRAANRRALSARLAGSRLRRAGTGFGLTAALGFVLSWSIAKNGSNINYCLDWQLALCPLAGIFIVLASRKWNEQHRVAVAGTLLVCLLTVTGLQMGFDSFQDLNKSVGLTSTMRELRTADRKEQADLTRFAAALPGPVVSQSMMVLVRAGKATPIEPSLVKLTALNGVFDETPFVRQVEDRFFDAFITGLDPDDFFSPRIVEAMRKNYTPYPFNGSHYRIYVRRTS